ncbi:glycoside hydrolase family 66 protein, partial [Paenibacillus sp. MCAF20]
EQLVRYYDFLVAYQNVLRDGVEDSELAAEGHGDVDVSSSPELNKVWSFTKQKGDSDIVHFINFTDATTLEWRDNEGKQAIPRELKDVRIALPSGKEVASIQFASPDYYNGSAVELSFEQKDGVATFKLPGLKYWDMVTVRYKQ